MSSTPHSQEAASVSPLLDDALLKKKKHEEEEEEEAEIAAAPYQHSWRHAPRRYTALSCLLWLVFFYQPHWLRVQAYGALRSVIADERTFYTVVSVLWHLIIFTVANGGMGLIYYFELPFFEQFKIQSRPWPWHRGAEERARYFGLIRKSLALIAFNHWVIAPTMMLLSYEGNRVAGITGAPGAENVPHWYTSVWQILVFMIVEDTAFYWAHRALHHPWIYAHVHKVHHTYRTSIGVASEYAHPIEFVFSNAIPFILGPLICGAHFFTVWQWTLLRIGETVDGHSGYEFPWSPYRLLPFSGSSTAHDFHHSHNVGNFASFFTYWDHICGTDQAFVKWEHKQIKLKHQKEHEANQQQSTTNKKLE